MKTDSPYVMNVEITDLFGGEANYSWVRRTQIPVPRDYSDLTLVRRAKAWAGWNGLRSTTESAGGECITVRPHGMLQIMFITVATAPAQPKPKLDHFLWAWDNGVLQPDTKMNRAYAARYLRAYRANPNFTVKRAGAHTYHIACLLSDVTATMQIGAGYTAYNVEASV
jgi:hypothetical protein